mmetsp:Transcript_57312/g.91240  ORF Transcript_57312/g.91240 Transcript_57312/m.91240 type:complete len:192 (-) Transcript_57312:38-613(-)|eukprot:CAMPEP_0197037510 /NCGR_PEP_ID=MMETSP1384-20130603/14704_1 /TAXON_ID=29189 /ORGANISM="Ammonia sp." /LENGTH=191 /DNA_ID=CAMNT_0042467823 /DNA_START=24 /DNA_END=599 /DNA_ORIENTATION=-
MAQATKQKEVARTPSWNFAVVICRNKEGKYLAVNETRNRGWWVPAGYVDPGESFYEGGIRETQEEAGLDVDLKGILRVEYGRNTYGSQSSARMRVIFYAEPKDENQKPKDKPDSESLEARFVTVKEFASLNKIRGPELVEWGTYLDNGGLVYPLELFTECFAKPSVPDYTMKHLNNCNNHSKLTKQDCNLL